MEFVGAVLGCLNLFLCFPAVSHLVRLGAVGKVSESGFSAAGSGKDGPLRPFLNRYDTEYDISFFLRYRYRYFDVIEINVSHVI